MKPKLVATNPISSSGLADFNESVCDLLKVIDGATKARHELLVLLSDGIAVASRFDQRSHTTIAAALGIDSSVFSRALNGSLRSDEIVPLARPVLEWLSYLESSDG